MQDAECGMVCTRFHATFLLNGQIALLALELPLVVVEKAWVLEASRPFFFQLMLGR